MKGTAMSNGRQAEKSEAAVRAALDGALPLFSSQGYGATSMRQIAEACGLSVGNLYHHFGSKEAIFERLIDDYFDRVIDPGHPLQKVFSSARFPDDLEDLAAAIEGTVDRNLASIKLVYIDVIEFEGKHIRAFYEAMAGRFKEAYTERFDELEREGRLGDADPLIAVMIATRWLFYFFTVEKCFGVPMHFGMDASQAVDGFLRILRHGVLRPDDGSTSGSRSRAGNTSEGGTR
jgi:AcrR family transcriptional regulator